MALRSASLAEEKGYRDLRVFKEGMPAWRKANQPVVVDADYVATILDEHHVIVDLRPLADSASGHIPTAFAFPAEQLAALERDSAARKGLPGLRDRLAPVVLYGADSTPTADAYRVVVRWGYSNAAMLDGGYAAWGKGRFPAESGPAKTRVQFTRQPVMGAVPADEFTRLVASGKAVILDVREDDEVAKGRIPGSVHIPLGKLNDEIDKLSPNDEILIHCAVGVRARMAFIRLKVRGFEHVRFLNEPIAIRPDGSFCIDCDP